MVGDSSTAQPRSRRKAWVWVAVVAAVVIIAVVVYFVVTSGRGSEEGSAVGGPTPTASVTPDPIEGDVSAPPAPDPSITPETMPELAPVAPDEASDNGQGLVAQIETMKAVEGEAVQPGEIAGPSVQFTLKLTNDTGAAIDLGLVAVNTYIGEERTPARSLVKPGGAPFEGTLEAGGSAIGVYIYNIPEDRRDDVTLTLDYRAGEPAFVFRGRVA